MSRKRTSGQWSPQATLKQIEELQSKMLATQESLERETVTATAGGGAIKVTMTGKQRLLSIEIAPEVSEDLEMLQDLVVAAVNEALEKSQELAASRLSALTGGLKIPGL
jgi:DNA-binding YbaB/EbfC family protein